MWWSLPLYVLIVGALATGLLAVSSILGERHADPATDEPFESGVATVGNARFRVAAKFYVVAVLFVIFDLEAVFLFGWAIAVREAGWSGFAEAVVFIAILGAALAYLWRAGALDWSPRGTRRDNFEVENRAVLDK
jgi:NADH-quinone oxidoreductase subunit A